MSSTVLGESSQLLFTTSLQNSKNKENHEGALFMPPKSRIKDVMWAINIVDTSLRFHFLQWIPTRQANADVLILSSIWW